MAKSKNYGQSRHRFDWIHGKLSGKKIYFILCWPDGNKSRCTSNTFGRVLFKPPSNWPTIKRPPISKKFKGQEIYEFIFDRNYDFKTSNTEYLQLCSASFTHINCFGNVVPCLLYVFSTSFTFNGGKGLLFWIRIRNFLFSCPICSQLVLCLVILYTLQLNQK